MDSQHEKSAAATQARPSHTNRLIDSSSPYLLQHAHNPVEWYPWGNEALEKARRENKPIFLSIGYAACHWCHVMEREVFEKPELAAIMNEHFVNIKVDREERPDLDDLYMMATQVMSGSGGWPMSVWLTPSLEPFYAGTYFPAEDGFGRPGFRRLDLALADAWKNRRGELEEQARRVVEAIRTHADESAGQDDGKPRSGIESMNGDGGREAWVRLGIEQLADRVDEVNGGLGSAPKFPPHQALLLWATVLETGAAGGVVGAMAEEKALAADGLVRTLDGMMRGGIYDHVGGAFARYSTDERWLVPHFEKMLYDSAQLAPVYALASVLLGRPDYARVARETLDFYMREMMNEKGAFYSSLDADSEGVEGKYYVWTVADVKESLESDGDGAELVTAYFGMAEGGATGNWHESPVEGGYVLAVGKSAEALARERNVSADDVWKQLEGCLRRMRTYRKARVRPGLDDKILTGWNALMVSALAVCGRVLREPKYLEAAHQLIGFLLTQHMEGGRRLMRVSRGGMPAHTDAFLDDHAYLLNGLMDLIDSTTATSLPGTMARKRALELADTLIRDFEDASRGGFYFTAQPPRHEKLFARMKNAADNATPSANGVAIRALLRLAQVSGKEQYREVAMRAVGAFAGNIARRPEYFPTILAALIEDAEATRRRAGGTIPMGGLGGIGMQPMPIPGMPEVGHHGILQLHVNTAGPIQAGKAFDITVRLTIAEGYHVQLAEPADREAFRTVARLRSTGSGAPVAASQAWDFPPGEKVDGHNGYKGKVEFRARCRAAAGISAGEHRMRVTVMAQPCSGVSCLPPERASAEFTLMVQG